MADLDITSSSPVVTPQVPSKAFDLWRISGINAVWNSPNGPMSFETFFQNARRPSEDAALEDGPSRVNYFISDLWAEAASDPEVASAVYTLTKLLERKAKESGVIA